MRDKPILHLAVVMLVGLLALQGCRGTGQDATAPSPVAPSASPVATAPSPVATAPSPSTKAPSALPKDPGSSAQVLQDAIRRVRARDTLAEDASKNGYPDLKDCLQRETPAQVKAPYLALAPWTFPASGKNDTDILVAYGKHQTEIQAAVKTFETVLPVLDRVLAKPNFLWPSEWDKGPAASVPNFVQLRAIVQNMVGYAEYCAVTGKPDQALQYLVGTIELGARVAQNGVLLSSMIGIALDSIGLEGAFQVLGRSPGLTAKDYRKALARLSSLPLTPRTMLDRMDEEHAFQMNTVDLLIRDPKLRESFPLGGNPEALERERNLLPTLYMMQRPSIARLHDPKEDGGEHGSCHPRQPLDRGGSHVPQHGEGHGALPHGPHQDRGPEAALRAPAPQAGEGGLSGPPGAARPILPRGPSPGLRQPGRPFHLPGQGPGLPALHHAQAGAGHGAPAQDLPLPPAGAPAIGQGGASAHPEGESPMTDRSYSLPLARRVRGGRLSETGFQVQTTTEETFEVSWRSLRRLHLGRIEPTTTRVVSAGSGPGRMAARMVGQALGAESGGEGDSGTRTEVEKGATFLVMDLYPRGEEVPFRLDSTGTNLRSLLGEEAGYSGEINMMALLRKVATAAPRVVDEDVGRVLARGKSAIQGYSDRDAFHAESLRRWRLYVGEHGNDEDEPEVPTPAPPGSAQAASSQADWNSASPRPAQASSSHADWNSPSAATMDGFVVPDPSRTPDDPFAVPSAMLSPSDQASRATALSAAFVVGLALLGAGAFVRFGQHPADWSDAVYWILGGAITSIAGLVAMSSRQILREHLREHPTVLRAWMVATAAGSLLLALAFGALSYGVFATLGAIGSEVDTGVPRVGARGARGLLVMVGIALGGAVGALVAVGFALNLLVLAAAPDEQVLTAPTLLDKIGLK